MGIIKDYFKEKKARKIVLNYDDETLDSKIKIQGTSFDRKRKLDSKQMKKLQYDFTEGMSVKDLSIKYDVSEWVIKYNTDPEFKAHQLKLREGKSKTHKNIMDAENRVNYKKYLVKAKKIKVAGVI